MTFYPKWKGWEHRVFQKVFLICLEYPLCMYKIEIKYRMLCYRAAVEPPGLTRLAFCRYQLRDW